MVPLCQCTTSLPSYQPLLAKEREEREGAASGMDTALKNGASGSVFIGD